MEVEIRVFLETRRARAFVELWAQSGRAHELIAGLGRVSGLFRESDLSYQDFVRFVAEHKETFQIRYHEQRQAVYSTDEILSAVLARVRAPSAKGTVLLDDYTPRQACPSCGQDKWHRRRSALRLRQDAIIDSPLFLTDAFDKIVRSDLRTTVDQENLIGAVYQPCYDLTTGEPVPNYFVLETASKLGAPVHANQELPVCLACGHWIKVQATPFEAGYHYSREQWSGDDIVATGDNPSLLCGTQRFVQLLLRYSHQFSLDSFTPVHLEPVICPGPTF